MAMICTNGSRECDGCGQCFRDAPTYTCPVCGDELAATDKVYKQIDEIIGCKHCIDVQEAAEALEEDI